MRRDANVMMVGALCLMAMSSAGCLERCVSAPVPRLSSGVRIPIENNAIEKVDILFEIDNSNSMSENQANLARNFQTLINQLVSPPTNPMTGRTDHPPVKSLHVGVISSDLGTPGSVVPSCTNSDTGDDGLLNPIRNGASMRRHQPWTSSPPAVRPARCTNDPNQYPGFLSFATIVNDASAFAEDFACVAQLSSAGCGLEQQLESVYRALVIHNPRDLPGNTDPNAGLVRDTALLSIVMVTDEEDGSTRDCRYAEAGVSCTDAVDVFDFMSPDWSSPTLNLRFYMYAPGSRQDPTWTIDRYIDPTRPARGFTSLKPGHPERVIFSAIAGVPLALPTRAVAGATEIDWDALLGRNPDGSDGYVGTSAEGPVSMRQGNLDPGCATRVVPACRREGTAPSTSCDLAAQYFAWPSRRVALVARRFAERYQNGTLSSICAADDAAAVATIAEAIQRRLEGRCSASLPTVPARCSDTPTAGCARPGDPIRLNCALREFLPAGVSAASACTAARGRYPAGTDALNHRDLCFIRQLSVTVGSAPSPGLEGFFLDTRIDSRAPSCTQHLELTAGAALLPGASVVLSCLAETVAPAASGEACSGEGEVGAACQPTRPGNAPCVEGDTRGCFYGGPYIESGSRACASGLCVVDRFVERPASTAADRARGVYCSCRCAVPSDLQASVDPSDLCECPDGFACRDIANEAFPPELRGSYCVRQ